MVRKQKEVVFHGTQEEAGGCILDTEVPAAKFYNTLFQDILDGKFTKVNIELYGALVKHNDAQRRKPEKRRSGFQKPLITFRDKKGKTLDDMVRLQDIPKINSEIGLHLFQEGWKQKGFSHAVIAYSKKEAARILAFGYISDEGKLRIFIRYKTLHQPTRTAEEVISTIRSRLTGFLEN